MGQLAEDLSNILPVLAVTELKCTHCGDDVPRSRLNRFDRNGLLFCCDGCLSVYFFLQSLKSDQRFSELLGTSEKLVAIRSTAEDFSALDLPPYRAELNEASIELFIEGIHCSSCVWILEKLPEIDERIISARLDIGRSVLKVWVEPDGRFEEVANLVLKLGYRPHPVLNEKESQNRIAEADRLTLKRMAVAAFAAMNVMIYSFSLYSGVDGKFGWLFRLLSLGVALPALTYSAYPFYQSALRALRNRRISIDLPIAIAFIAGYIESVRQTILGTNLLYLDSLTSLVFLMLMSRYALSRLERAELSKSGLLQALLPQRVWKVSGLAARGLSRVRVRIGDLNVGDELELEAGEKVPADGVVTVGTAYIDLSFLTGESRPIRVKLGDSIFAGSRILDGSIRFEVTGLGQNTRLGNIEARLESYPPQKNSRTERSDRWASVFLAVVMGLAAVLLISFGRENAAEAIKRSLSLLIIACPCALALATPLALSRAFRLATSKGILVRDLDVFERLLKVDRVIFDKTGTLTQAKPVVTKWEWSTEFSAPEKLRLMSIAFTMEQNARHPYGRAIAEHLSSIPEIKILHAGVPTEKVGVGVSMPVEDELYSIGMDPNGADPSSGIYFYQGTKRIAEISVQDELRPRSHEVIAELIGNGLAVEILSGDGEEAVSKASNELGITRWKSRVSPENKSQYIAELAKSSRVLFVGDGVNDAIALKDAYVGVSINRNSSGAAHLALASADTALLKPELQLVPELFKIAKRYRSTLFRGAAFSVFYNLVGAGFAVTGHIHPLVAAIAMPVSALTLFISTVLGLSDSGSEDL